MLLFVVASSFMEHMLRVCTFNCKNVNTSGTEISNLCDMSDVIFLQETWLYDFELPMLSTLCNDYYGRGISSMDFSAGLLARRPYGGLGVLWRKSLDDRCEVVELGDNRFVRLEIIVENNVKLFFVNIYICHVIKLNMKMTLFLIWLN